MPIKQRLRKNTYSWMDTNESKMEKITPETYDKHIKALMDISRAITSDLYLEDILKLIVMVTAKVTGVEICSLWLIDDTVTPVKIRLKATQAIDPDYVKTGH